MSLSLVNPSINRLFYYCSILILLFSASAKSAAFEKAFGNSSVRIVNFVPTSDYGFVGIGSILDSATNHSAYYILQLDSLGSKVWDRTIADAFPSYGYAIDTLPGGNIAFIGTHDGFFFNDVAEVTILDASGNDVSQNIYPPFDGWGTSGVGLTTNPDSSLAITLYTDGFISNNYFSLFKLNKNLSVDWTDFIGYDGSQINAQGLSSSNASAFWTMSFYDIYFYLPMLQFDVTNLKMHDADGNLIIDSLYHFNCTATSVYETVDGGVLVSGYTTHGNVTDIVLIKLDELGVVNWRKTYPLNRTNQISVSACQSSDGGFACTAAVSDTLLPQVRNILLLKTNAMGDSLWSREFGTANDEYPIQIKQCADGGFGILGVTNGYENSPIYVIKTDSMGIIPAVYSISSQNHSICEGDTAHLSIQSVLPYNEVVWSTGDTTFTLEAITTGNYFATVTDTNGLIYTTPTFHLFVAIQPRVNLGTDSVSLCTGQLIRNLNTQSDFSLQQHWLLNQMSLPGEILSFVTPSDTGMYSLIVENFCGSDTGQIYVSQLFPTAAMPVITSPQPSTVCEGDSILLLVVPQSASAFQWYTKLIDDLFVIPAETDSSYNVLNPGLYVVEITDANGCQAFSNPYSVDFDMAPEFINTSGTTALCSGESVMLELSSGSNYQWSTGDTTTMISVDSSGMFWAVFTSVYGCPKATDTISVSVNPLPFVTIGPDTTVCHLSSYSLNAGSGFNSYEWSTGSTDQFLVLSTTLSYDSASYFVLVTDTNGCQNSDSAVVVFDICSGFIKASNDGFNIFPNPVGLNQLVHLSLPNKDNYYMTISDLTGRKIKEVNCDCDQILFDVSSLKVGVFLINLSDKNNRKLYNMHLLVK